MLFGLCKIIYKGVLIGYRILDSDKLVTKDVPISSVRKFINSIDDTDGNIDRIKCIDICNPDKYNLNIINRSGRYADKLSSRFVGISKDISKETWVICDYAGKAKTVTFEEYDSLLVQGRIINCTKQPLNTISSKQTGINNITRSFVYSVDTMELQQYRGNSRYVSIPVELLRIGEGAFIKCNSIEELFIWGKRIFSKGSFRESIIKSVSIEDNELIQTEMFEDSIIKEFKADNKLMRIGDRAFRNCSNLNKLNIEAADIKIGNSAFSGCLKLKEFSSSISELGHNAFADSGIVNISLSDSLDYIGNGAFRNCKALKYLEIPCNVQGIGLDIIKGSGVCTVYINKGAIIDNVQSLFNDSVKHIIGYKESFAGYDISGDKRFNILG